MLRLTIQRKVFLAMSSLAIAVTLLLVTMTMWNLEKGFARYTAEMELGELGQQVEQMQRNYAASGSWAFLRNNEAAWRQLTRPYSETMGHTMLPPPNHPPSHQPFPETYTPRFGAAPPPPAIIPPLPANDPLAIFPRLSLEDNKGELVAGSARSSNMVWRPLFYNGKEIGRLLLAPNHNPESTIASAFLSSQMRNLWISGLAGLLLSLLASWWLSRHFLSPIRELATGSHALAKGDFTSRIPQHGEDELAELSRDFNQMAAQLEQIELSRSRWISDTSHELRTPLSVLRAEIEAMQDGIRTADGETLARLHRQVLQLGKLVDDLRLTQSSEVGGMAFQFDNINILTLLHETCEGFQARYARAGLVIDGSALPENTDAWTIRADGDRLLQVFNNLIENSLRYTDPGGRLRLSTTIRDNQCSLIFDDTPPAPPEAEMANLFDRFFRVEQSRSRSFGGSGLGLTICKQIIAAHDGEIHAESSPLGGLRIRLTLPGNA